VLPCAEYYKRQGFPLKKIVAFASGRDFSDLLVFNEDRKEVNGLLHVHLPDGPTAHYRISSLVLGQDIKVWCGLLKVVSTRWWFKLGTANADVLYLYVTVPAATG
jgi:hypothetical protein